MCVIVKCMQLKIKKFAIFLFFGIIEMQYKLIKGLNFLKICLFYCKSIPEFFCVFKLFAKLPT